MKSIYRPRDYAAEYRRWATQGDAEMLDGTPQVDLKRHDARKAIRALPPPRIGSIVDIGCGSATLLRKIAGLEAFRGCNLVGILPSAEEVSLAVAVCQQNPICQRIEIRLGTALQTGLLSGSQDAAYLNQMFHYLEPASVPSVLQEIRRVLRPGGGIYVGGLPDRDEFAHHSHDDSIWDWLSGHVLRGKDLRSRLIASAKVARYAVTGRGFVQHMKTPYFAAPEIFRQLLADAGFGSIQHVPYVFLDDGRLQTHPYRYDYWATRSS